jgi:hypothetical protein
MKSVCRAQHLTPRDLALLEMVCRYEGCGIAHVHRRLWPEGSGISGCYRRVGMLEDARYLRVHRLPALIPHGSGKGLLTPGPRAATFLSDRVEERQFRRFVRKHEVAAFFAEHHFAICDFRVALELAVERVAGVSLDGWVLESVMKRNPIRVADVNQLLNATTHPITLIPDAAFKLSVRGEERVAYLEMDMGTIAHSRLKQRLRGYLLLSRSEPDPTPLFFVTTSNERVIHVVDAIEEQATNLRCDPTTIFVACCDEVATNTILTGPIWHRAGVSHPTAILPHAELLRQGVSSGGNRPAA